MKYWKQYVEIIIKHNWNEKINLIISYTAYWFR